jgi:hypothetical protein
VGTLHGDQVHVFRFPSLGFWSFAVIHPKGFVEVCLRADSLADEARRAREWIEWAVSGGKLVRSMLPRLNGPAERMGRSEALPGPIGDCRAVGGSRPLVRP